MTTFRSWRKRSCRHCGFKNDYSRKQCHSCSHPLVSEERSRDTAEKWTQYNPAPVFVLVQPVAVSSRHFVVATKKSSTTPNPLKQGLWQFDTLRQQWSILCPYPEGIFVQHASLFFDRSLNSVLMLARWCRGYWCCQFHLSTKQFEIVYVSHTGEPDVISDGLGSNGQGSATCSSLLATLRQWHLEHWSSPNQILLAGDELFWLHPLRVGAGEVWRCPVNQGEGHCRADWSKQLKMPDNLWDTGFAMSLNGRYMVIVGGKDFQDNRKDSIFVVDTVQGVFRKSPVKAPFEGAMQAIVVDHDSLDRLLVSGFLREFELNVLKQFIPPELVGLVSHWYSAEMLHLFNFDQHWKISMDAILQDSASSSASSGP